MKEIWREHSKDLTQAGLQGERGPAKVSSRSWRCSWGLEKDQALEARQQGRQSWSGRRTHSRGRSGLRQWHSPSPSDASPQKEEKPRKQVQFEVDEEFGAEPDLSAELVHFLAEEASIPTKSPQHSHAPAGGTWTQPKILAAASSGQSHSWSQTRTGRERPNPVRYPCWWITNELSQSSNPHPHWWREIKASRKLSVGAHIVQKGYGEYSTQHYALWQAAAFRLPLAQQEASGWWDALLPYAGFVYRTFFPLPQTHGISGPSTRKKTLALARALQVCAEASGAKPGVLCRAVRELQQCMALLMAIDGDDVMEASLLGLVEEELGPSPTLEEEAVLLGERDMNSGAPCPAPQQVKSPRFIEPVEWTTTPVTSIAPHCCPSLKRGKSWEGIGITLNNTGLWVSTYLKKDSWLPEWWEEFQPLPHFEDGCHRDAKAKHPVHQQAVDFHLLAAQKAVHGAWLTPYSLAELKRKEYLGPKDPWLTLDYWEVWKEETIMLAIILQWCTIRAGAPSDTFCREVQELHRQLALVVEESDWVNMEDPMVAVSPRPPMSRRKPSQIPRVEKLMASISPSASQLEGTTPPQDLALVPRRQPPPPPGFSYKVPEGLILPAIEGAYLPGTTTLFDLSTLELLEMTISHTPVVAKVHYHLQAWCLARITLLDSSTWRYLGPFPRDEEDWANACPKYELKQIPTLLMKWTFYRANTHSPNKMTH